MTLVNRVSAYFLAALAVVLFICSALFYGVVSRQLTQQFDQQLHSALHSLAAAVEVETDEVKWQAAEHTTGLGAGEGPEEIRWVVIGDDVAVVEASRNASDKFLAEARSLAADASAEISAAQSPALQGWRFLRQRLSAARPERFKERELDEFDEIVVVVGRSTTELNANLSRLALFAGLLPLGGWLAAAAVGRWLCKRALQPVLVMAREARSMSGADFQLRMPVSSSGDELTDLGDAFNTVLDRLQRSFDAQRRFTGDAAHELRTPLTVLLGQIDVARRKPRSADEYRGTLDLLHDEASELRQILEALLFLARADEDARAPEVTRVQLADWLPQHLQQWADDPRRPDIELLMDGPAEVAASGPLLSRLFDNLLSNALKYSKAGTPVVIKLSRDGNDAVITVADQGRGIAAQDLSSVFDPFFRTQAARSAGTAGIGLGLAIAGRIAGTFGGRLTCRSEVGRGSVFSLFLPCIERPAREDEADFNHASSQAYPPGQSLQ